MRIQVEHGRLVITPD
ncbi:hypothetical protein [Paraburkholderia xenovorans]